MYAHALQGPPFFPQRVMPAAAAALIAACLRRDAAARPLASAVWEWDYFGAGSFLRGEALLREAVLARTAPPPFVPRLRSPLDASHFDLPPDSEGSDAEDEGEGQGQGQGRHIAVAQPGGGLALAAPRRGPSRRGGSGAGGGGSELELRGPGDGALHRDDFHPPDRPCPSVDELLGRVY